MKFEFEPIGVVRQIDDLGRIVIPRDMRKKSHIHMGDSFEIFADSKGNFYLKHIIEQEVEK